jgi:putative ABC transport system permease protein
VARGQEVSEGLVVAEVAVSVALLVGTGLLLRSFSGLRAVDPGFEPEGVLTLELSLASQGRSPEGGGLSCGSFKSEAMATSGGLGIEADFRYVTPRFFDVLGAQLQGGRVFLPEDGVQVVLVDETAAEEAWPGESPIGKRILTSTIGQHPTWSEVIGVIATVKHSGVSKPGNETVYLPMFGQPFHNLVRRRRR